jgi:hypothetical protein
MALTWRKASWPDKTYHARQGARSFTADSDGQTWRLRGWIDGKFADFVQDLPSLRAAKAVAEERLTLTEGPE